MIPLVRPSPRASLLALSLFVLNVFDAVATVFLLDRGAVELNPLMSWFLGVGVWAFMLVKTVGVAALSTVMLFLSFDRRVDRILIALTSIYGVVTIYHLINLGSLL